MALNRRQFLFYSTLAAASVTLPYRRALASPPTAITSFPTTITTPGMYVLTQDHTISLDVGRAIEVACSEVIIDLSGHTLENAFGTTNTSAGVYAATTANNVQLLNGTIRGFYTGALFDGTLNGAGRRRIEDIAVEQCSGAGLLVMGDGSIIRNNQITTTSRSTPFILPSCTSTILGIGLEYADYAIVVGNQIALNKTGAQDFALGIYVGGASSEVITVDNVITDADFGIVYNSLHYSRGEARNTQTTNVSRVLVGGEDLGNNV